MIEEDQSAALLRLARCGGVISPPSCKDSGDAKEPTEFFHERGFELTFKQAHGRGTRGDLRGDHCWDRSDVALH
jgi:hypothetical protein